MSLADKAQENFRVAKKCCVLKAYNAGVSRAYYATFQQAKYYLIKNNFDYIAFLQKKNKSAERPFSHGTIQQALVDCMVTNKKKYADIGKVNIFDNIYRKRIIAAYDNKDVDEVDLIQSMEDFNKLLTVLKS